jgi:hypothetical protein
LVQAAFRLPWSYRDELFRLGIVPALLSFAIEMIGTLLGNDALPVVMLADLVPITMFQVAVYRLLLLGPAAVTPGIKPSWGRREFRFFGLNLVIGLAVMVIGLVMLLLLGDASVAMASMLLLVLGVSLLASYAYSRVSVAFPAVAVDHPLRLSEAARCTQPVGGRLWLALVLTVIPVAIVMVVVSKFLEVTGLAGAAPLATAFILVVLGYAASTIMLVPVALAFRELCGWSGPPAPAWNGQ